MDRTFALKGRGKPAVPYDLEARYSSKDVTSSMNRTSSLRGPHRHLPSYAATQRQSVSRGKAPEWANGVGTTNSRSRSSSRYANDIDEVPEEEDDGFTEVKNRRLSRTLSMKRRSQSDPYSGLIAGEHSRNNSIRNGSMSSQSRSLSRRNSLGVPHAGGHSRSPSRTMSLSLSCAKTYRETRPFIAGTIDSVQRCEGEMVEYVPEERLLDSHPVLGPTTIPGAHTVILLPDSYKHASVRNDPFYFACAMVTGTPRRHLSEDWFAIAEFPEPGYRHPADTDIQISNFILQQDHNIICGESAYMEKYWTKVSWVGVQVPYSVQSVHLLPLRCFEARNSNTRNVAGAPVIKARLDDNSYRQLMKYVASNPEKEEDSTDFLGSAPSSSCEPSLVRQSSIKRRSSASHSRRSSIIGHTRAPSMTNVGRSVSLRKSKIPTHQGDWAPPTLVIGNAFSKGKAGKPTASLRSHGDARSDSLDDNFF
ncbi:hypothetical protein MMC09_004113 [Bachmanniomyces sp. S44760]|nr:hypothetical protein [Bachmanniomyces sp. S44760]